MLGNSESIRDIRIDYHLNQTGAVTQVNKNNTAMVAATMYPTADFNGCP